MKETTSLFRLKMIKWACAAGVLLAASARALEIPLKKAGGDGGTTVGYVDMEAVFQEYPETAKARKAYYAELAKRREALAERERELSALREDLRRLREGRQAPAGAPASAGAADSAETSTGTVSATPAAPPGEDIPKREKDLAEKETALEQSRADAAKSLKELEETRSLQIMGKLYNALVQLAEENGIGLVVDKSSILYGRPAIDLTGKLNRRIRGLPEVEPE
jgi:Skp family chaperone for outer membrane proteins